MVSCNKTCQNANSHVLGYTEVTQSKGEATSHVGLVLSPVKNINNHKAEISNLSFSFGIDRCPSIISAGLGTIQL